MAVFRVNRNQNYTHMANYHFRDNTLSWKAKGILSNMLSLPEDWDYSLAGLATLASDGMSATRSAIKELEEHGYLMRRPIRENGKISDWEYLIFEKPQIEKPDMKKPVVENQQVENQTQLSTKELNTEKSNTDELNTKERVDYQKIVDLFNSICVSYPSVRTISSSRKKAIKARLNTYTLAEFRTVFENAEASSFMKGKNDRNWSADFDWMIKDSSMAKILEGKYADKPKRYGRKEPVPGWMEPTLGEAELEAIQRVLKEEPESTIGNNPELAERAARLREQLQGESI